MRAEDLANLRKWFRHYIRTFAQNGKRLHPLLQLKAHHSARVAKEAQALASDLGWSSGDRNVAEALGLLHDIGRFPQFSRHRTFADARSCDHGECGWAIARKCAPLSGLPRAEREWILNGIRYHNRRVIPAAMAPRRLAFLNLIRDADKLDIMRVTLEYVERDGFQDLPDMLPGITLARTPSRAIVQELCRRQTCSLRKVKSLGDFFAMQLSWIYDLRYVSTCRCVVERGILARILRQIDGGARVQNLGAQLNYWVAGRLGENPQNKRSAMPIYEYQCHKCGKTFEHLMRSSAEPPPACPYCGAKRPEKQYSAFSAVPRGSAACPTGTCSLG